MITIIFTLKNVINESYFSLETYILYVISVVGARKTVGVLNFAILRTYYLFSLEFAIYIETFNLFFNMGYASRYHHYIVSDMNKSVLIMQRKTPNPFNILCLPEVMFIFRRLYYT